MIEGDFGQASSEIRARTRLAEMVLVQTLGLSLNLPYFPAPCRLKQKKPTKRGGQAERLAPNNLSVAVLPHIIAPDCLISTWS